MPRWIPRACPWPYNRGDPILRLSTCGACDENSADNLTNFDGSARYDPSCLGGRCGQVEVGQNCQGVDPRPRNGNAQWRKGKPGEEVQRQGGAAGERGQQMRKHSAIQA